MLRARNSIRLTSSADGGQGRALSMLADTPIESDDDDELGFCEFADALAEVIDSPATYTPLTLAISAPWGAGKTSLAKLVESRLEDWPLLEGRKPHVVCWFNAWLHDDADHLGAALAADVAKTANKERSIWRRLVSPLPSAMLSPQERWRRRLVIGVLALVAAIPAALASSTREVIVPGSKSLDFGASLASTAVVLGLIYLVWTRLFSIAQAASSFIDDPSSEASKGAMNDVREQLGKIVRQATHHRRLIVFVDDLERCRPPRAVDICEAATQLLGHPQVVTVLVGDMNAIAAAAAIKYADLEGKYMPDGEPAADETSPLTYGRAYLEKIVQIQFDLPPPSRTALAGMVGHEHTP